MHRTVGLPVIHRVYTMSISEGPIHFKYVLNERTRILNKLRGSLEFIFRTKSKSYFRGNLQMTPKFLIMLLNKLREPCYCRSDSHHTIVELLTVEVSKSTQQFNKAEECICFSMGLHISNRVNIQLTEAHDTRAKTRLQKKIIHTPIF